MLTLPWQQKIEHRPTAGRRRVAVIGLALFIFLTFSSNTPGHAAKDRTTPALTPVFELQGTGAVSPVQGEWHDTFGIITGVTAKGFFLQDPVGDDNLLTSDGIFVYTRSRPAVKNGQCVVIRGALVDEFYDKTELSRQKDIEPSTLCDSTVPRPASIPWPRFARSPADVYERYEGMLVQIDEFAGIVHGPTKWYGSGESELILIDATLQPYVMGARIYQHQSDLVAALLPVSNLLGGNVPQAGWGDRVERPAAQSLTGVLDYNFGKYQLLALPGQDLHQTGGETPHAAATPASTAEFTVCSYNLFGLGRGAEQFVVDTTYWEEVDRRSTIIAGPLAGCTIVALQEAGTPADVAALAERLAARFGLDYTPIAFPGPATAAADFPLTNGLLIRTAWARVAEASVRQGCSGHNYGVVDTTYVCPAGEYPLFNRPPLVADLAVTGDWGPPLAVRVIDNHWKSKAGNELENAPRRYAQATVVAALAQERLTEDRNAHVIVIGDLNDFVDSQSVSALRTGTEPNLVNLWEFQPRMERYNYIFNGASQVLDHILVTPGLTQMVAGARIVRVNADRASPRPGAVAADQRTSDHDPLVLRIKPEGSAAFGGAIGFPSIGVEVYDARWQLLGRTATDALGEFRLWGLPPGDVIVRLRFDTEQYDTNLSADAPLVRVTLSTGYTEAPSFGVRHRGAQWAATLARHTFDLANLAFQ